MLTGCMPSTSLSGSIASSAASKSICGGVGCWMRKPSTERVVVERAHRGEHVVPGSRPRAGADGATSTRAPAPSPSSCRRSARWRRRRRRGSCRGPGVCPLAISFSLRGTRSANTASATGPPGIILRSSSSSVEEVPFAGEHHGDAELVGAFDVGLVAHRATRLHHDRDARPRPRPRCRRGTGRTRPTRTRRRRRDRRPSSPRSRPTRPGSAGRRRCRRPGRPSPARSRSTSRARRCARPARRRATRRRWAPAW